MAKNKIIIVTLVLILLGAFFYSQIYNRTQIETGLSDMGKRYLDQQKKNGNVLWTNVALDKIKSGQVDAAFRQREKMNVCFNFAVPFVITNYRQEGKCSEYFAFSDPKGTIVAFEEQSTTQNLGDYTGVSMRRIYKDKYEESQQKINGRDFSIFKVKDSNYQKTAFYLNKARMFVLTLTLNTSAEKEFDKQFKDILASLDFYD